MTRLRTRLALAATLAVITTSAWAQEQAPDQAAPSEPDLAWMGTGSVAGVYYPVGVSLCRLVNQHRPETGLRCAATPSEGSVGNIRSLRDGTFQLAIVQSDNQAEAVAGTGPFADAGPFEGLRSVMSLYPESLAVVARADAGISSIENLAGKRVALGGPGTGTRTIADALLDALGWTPASFAATPDIPPERVSDALCSGEIDAFLYAVGHPALVIQEATTTCDARLIDAAGPAIDELVSSRPYYVSATIPAGLYRGNEAAVSTFGVTATLVTRADYPDDTVYGIVQAIFGDLDMLRGLVPVLADLDPQTMVRAGLAAPLHPGAARYYREQGLID
jgi:TRAP transporter TAXI family solute receptor